MEKIKAAISIALHAPSACNRQGVRAYVIAEKSKDALKDWLVGLGGFADAVPAKLSSSLARSVYIDWRNSFSILSVPQYSPDI